MNADFLIQSDSLLQFFKDINGSWEDRICQKVINEISRRYPPGRLDLDYEENPFPCPVVGELDSLDPQPGRDGLHPAARRTATLYNC